MRVEAGAVVDEFEIPGIGQVVARHTRMKAPDGGATWACTFTVLATGVSDLAVVHRLSAPTLAEGRRSVRQAVEFLTGRTPLGPEAPQSLAPSPFAAPSFAAPPVAPPPTGSPPFALPPTPPPRNRRATDRTSADRGRIPDLNTLVPDGSPRFPVFDLSHAGTAPDAESGSLDPESGPPPLEP